MYELNNNRDCLFYCIEQICNNFEGNYEMVLLAGWKFGYEEGKTIGESLEYGNIDNIQRIGKLLYKYHKIKMKLRQYSNVDVIDDYMKMGIPVVLRCDTYWCEWLPYYNKQHGKHSLLVQKKDCVGYFFEDQFCDEARKIDKDFIEKHCFEIIAFIKDAEAPQVGISSYQEEIKRCADFYEVNKGGTQHKQFIYDLVHSFSIENEIEGKDILQSAFIKHLSFLAEDRKSMILGIQYIQLITKSTYEIIIQKLHELVNAYNELKIYIIKCCYINKFDRSAEFVGICEKIQELEQTVQSLLKEQ